MNSQYIGQFTNNRLLARREHSQPLLFDMRFDNPQQNKFHAVITQLMSLHTINKFSPDPFRMIHVNLKEGNNFNFSI